MLTKEVIQQIQIKIPEKEVLRYLGYQKDKEKGSLEISKMIQEEANKAASLFENCSIFQFIPVLSIRTNGQICLKNGDSFRINSRIAHLLKGSKLLLIALSTIGSKLEERVKERFSQNEYVQAIVLDAIGTVAVKTVAQWTNHLIEQKIVSQGLRISRYFSPGSGEWDIREQKIIFDLLKPEEIGVKLTPSFMMQPAKSLTWIRGLGQKIIHSYRDEFSCNDCLMKNCHFRKTYPNCSMINPVEQE